MKYDINLLSKKQEAFFDRAVHFALYYLRYILVITQLVVILVLFYRFKIDNDILELRDQIAQKREIIRVTTPLLEEVTRLDVQVSGTLDSTSKQAQMQNAFTYLLSVFPSDVTLSKFSVQNGQYSLVGSAPDAQVIQLFYGKLRQDKRFGVVTLENLIKSSEAGISFSLILDKFKS